MRSLAENWCGMSLGCLAEPAVFGMASAAAVLVFDCFFALPSLLPSAAATLDFFLLDASEFFCPLAPPRKRR